MARNLTGIAEVSCLMSVSSKKHVRIEPVLKSVQRTPCAVQPFPFTLIFPSSCSCPVHLMRHLLSRILKPAILASCHCNLVCHPSFCWELACSFGACPISTSVLLSHRHSL